MAFTDHALIEPAVAARWLNVHGDTAHMWLEKLPTIISRLTDDWGLTVDGALRGGSTSIILAARHNDLPVVLKLAAPWTEWPCAEAAALRAWDGEGTARLLTASRSDRAFLMERVLPGTPVRVIRPTEIGDLMACIWQPRLGLPSEAPSLTEAVASRFRRASENRHGLVDAKRLSRAACAADELATASSSTVALLHGDLLKKNVLCGADGTPTVIDPMPAIGDPCYDVAQWAITEQPMHTSRARCNVLAAHLGLDAERVWDWALVLGIIEICLASEARARATRTLVALAAPAWW